MLHQYKEQLITDSWWRKDRPIFRYRFDPVPYIHNWHKSCRMGSIFKHPKTTQEKRKYYDAPEYVRAKRRPINLPDLYDDFITNRIKRSWKRTKKRKQYE